MPAGVLSDFFKLRGKASAKSGKKLATNIMKNPGRALEGGAQTEKAAVIKNLTVTSSSIFP